jgi:hypothetical protein
VIDPVGHTDTPRRASPGNIANFKEATGKDPESAGAAQALRLNWTTPFIVSPHDPKTLYYGANYLLRTSDKGVTWKIVSPDLSKNDATKNNKGTGGITPDDTGAEGYGTIYSISESPVSNGRRWMGGFPRLPVCG